MLQITGTQILGLFVLAIPIACIARTIIYEEVFREPREWCQHKSVNCRNLMGRKFFYLFTCEYCFSHWVTLGVMLVTRYWLLFPDWRGHLVGFFSLVFVANIYLNLYSRIRVELTSEKKQIEAKEAEIAATKKHIEAKDLEIRKLDAELTGNGTTRATASERQ